MRVGDGKFCLPVIERDRWEVTRLVSLIVCPVMTSEIRERTDATEEPGERFHLLTGHVLELLPPTVLGVRRLHNRFERAQAVAQRGSVFPGSQVLACTFQSLACLAPGAMVDGSQPRDSFHRRTERVSKLHKKSLPQRRFDLPEGLVGTQSQYGRSDETHSQGLKPGNTTRLDVECDRGKTVGLRSTCLYLLNVFGLNFPKPGRNP